MGLLTKEVDVCLAGNNIKYYEGLGYQIPRRKSYGRMSVPIGTTITVKIEDVLPCSMVNVELKCDNCGRHTLSTYCDYNKHNHNGLTYCENCANTVLHSGKNNPNYKPEIAEEERNNRRNYPAYKDFVKRVLARDNYTCQCCNRQSNNDIEIEVHHLGGYHWCIEKRTDDANGITLCTDCHSNYHSLYGKLNNTKEQFEEWIGHTIENLKIYNGILSSAKRVYCLEDGKVYCNAIQASKFYGIHYVTIYNICNHKSVSSNGYHFLWEHEYLMKTSNEIEMIKHMLPSNIRKTICITTGIIFNGITASEKHYNIHGVNACCNNRQKTAGKLSDGTPLQWMYYEDFLKLPIEEQNKILNRNQEPSIDGSFTMKIIANHT